MAPQLQPAMEAGDSSRVWALQGNQQDVAKTVAVKLPLHVEVANPLIGSGELLDSLCEPLQQLVGLAGGSCCRYRGPSSGAGYLS